MTIPDKAQSGAQPSSPVDAGRGTLADPAPGGSSATPVGTTVILVATLCGIYVVGQLLRNSIGVIAPDLARDIGLTAAQVGLLSSVFFFSFAVAQIPLGICLDRYGPKICMLVCAVVAALGAVLFALSASAGMLILARVLMGLGCCSYLMAPLSIYAKRYPPERFGAFAGIQFGIGALGTLLATAPLAWSVTAIGWRGSFLAVAGLVVIAGVMIALVVREDGPGAAAPGAHRETLRDSIAGLAQVLRVRSIGKLCFGQLAAYSSFVLVVGLWGGPYLTHIYGYGLTERGDVLFAAVLTQILTTFVSGSADRMFQSYKIPVLTCFLLTALAFSVVAVVGVLPAGLVLPWFIAIGVVTSITAVLFSHGKSILPLHLTGRGMTLLNLAAMGGVFLTQTVSGFVINLFPIVNGGYALDAYRLVFGMQALLVLAVCVPYALAHDPWRER